MTLLFTLCFALMSAVWTGPSTSVDPSVHVASAWLDARSSWGTTSSEIVADHVERGGVVEHSGPRPPAARALAIAHAVVTPFAMRRAASLPGAERGPEPASSTRRTYFPTVPPPHTA